MEPPRATPPATVSKGTIYALGAATLGFFGLAVLFLGDLWGHPPPRQAIPLVDRSFLEQTPWRRTYMDLVRAKEDLSDFDCYACHEKGKPPPLRFDANHILIVPDEHKDIVMGHGTHNRNNLCYNCHNESNLETFQVRDGREIKFADSTQLCGSCHGPNYRDWEAGAHGRINGYWNTALGPARRLDCANCHNPHAPHIPTRVPAPPPHPLRVPLTEAHHPASP
ncbi:MAG TPA: hypothetical protein VG936_02100 [Lacunisphaera sp.]|nr:hypothetical protein [Lacunisphaera sp.]